MIHKNNMLIFDMDGTLLDSKKDITSSINFVRKQKGLDRLTVDEVVKAINQDIKLLPKILYNTEKYEKQDRELFENHYYQECIKSTKPYEGITEILEYFINLDFKLCVATNAPTTFALRMLENTKLINFFDYVAGVCEVNQPKPSPEIILKILKKFDTFNKDNVIIIGDNHSDIEAGHNAGIKTAYVDWGFGKKMNLKTDFHFYEPKELLKLANLF